MTDIESEKKIFKSSVKEIEDLEETIKTTRDRLKLLNTRKKTLQSNIKVYMQKHEVAQVITKNKKIVRTTSRRTTPIKKKDLRENIINFFKNINMDSFNRLSSDQKTDQLLEYLNNQRKVTISDNISFRKV
jgi:seryl-tRNA synthetase